MQEKEPKLYGICQERTLFQLTYHLRVYFHGLVILYYSMIFKTAQYMRKTNGRYCIMGRNEGQEFTESPKSKNIP